MSADALPRTQTATEPRRQKKPRLSDRTKAERRLAIRLIAPAVIVMLAVAGFPIVDTIVISLQKSSLDQPGMSSWLGVDNYGYVFTAHLFWVDFLHTVVITVISVSIEFVLGMLLAITMHRIAFFRGFVRSVALVPYSIVAVVAAYSWYYAWSLDNGGWIPRLLGLSGDPLSHQFGSYVAIIMTEIWKNTPYVGLLLLAGLSLVPDDLLEAAEVDGASTWQRFTKITLPMMKPAILVALLFRTLDAFRIFDVVYIFNQGANNTATLSQLSYSTLLERLNLGLGSAVSVVLFLIVGVIAFLFIKGFGAAANPAAGRDA